MSPPTPTVEYRSTLAAAMLTSVIMASAVLAAERQSGSQYVVPADPDNERPSRWEDIRVLTNAPSDLLLQSGERVNTGDYLPHFLDHVASTVPGFTYEVRTEAVPKKKLTPKVLANYLAENKARARRCSFAFVEGGHIVSIYAFLYGVQILSWDEFADTCGLVIGNSRKISKRLKEIVRTTRMFVALNTLVVRKYEDDDPTLTQESVDGFTHIRRSVVLKACLDPRTRRDVRNKKIVRVIIRLIGPNGLIKGDAQIVDDDAIPADVYTSKHNIKDELRTKEGYILALEPHHGHAPMWTNDQVMSWFPALFPLDLLRKTVRKFLSDIYKLLRAGEYPSYFDTLPKLKDGLDQIGLFRMAPHKWIHGGLRINQTAALPKQAGNAFPKQLLSDPAIVYRNGRWRKDFTKQDVHVPVIWALYGHILTDVAYKLGGGKIPEGAEGKLFYAADAHSIVIPATHFAKYYREHGGWDLDDGVGIPVRELVPSGEESGAVKAFIIRSPNQWGEYSYLDVYMDGLPLYFQYGPIPKVYEDDLPGQLSKLELDEEVKPLPEGTFVLGDKYGHEDFDYLLECAVINPGTGSLINLLCIAYNSIFGTYNRKPYAETEDVVDTTQQNPSLEGLRQLVNIAELAKEELIAALLEGQPVDRLIFERRLNLSEKEKNELRGQVNLVDGHFSQLKQIVLAEIKEYRSALDAMAIRERQQLPLQDIDFSSVAGTEAVIWDGFRAVAAAANRIVRPEEQRELWQAHNRQMVARLMVTPEARRDLVLLNFMNWCYQEEKNDTALFGTSAVVDGVIETSVTDLLIEALQRAGLATDPNAEWDSLTDLIEEALDQ